MLVFYMWCGIALEKLRLSVGASQAGLLACVCLAVIQLLRDSTVFYCFYSYCYRCCCFKKAG